MGYPLVAAMVGAHMDIEVDEYHPLTEAEVVCLADKMVKGRYIVSMKDRFSEELDKYIGDLQTYDAALKQLKKVELIIAKIKNITGHTIESVPVSEICFNKLCC